MALTLVREPNYKDRDGRLHIISAHISRAGVSQYYGREVVDYDKHGLDPNKIYRLLRDPDALRRSVRTFDSLPILSEHVPVTADSFPWAEIIGTTGNNTSFDGVYLNNSLVFWQRDAVEAIENRTRIELAAAYYYEFEAVPGTYQDAAYDGRMKNIHGNHIALVEKCRLGPDVAIGVR
jgi:uncharacterized protein